MPLGTTLLLAGVTLWLYAAQDMVVNGADILGAMLLILAIIRFLSINQNKETENDQ